MLVLTADHGMNDKHLPNGEPDVIYLQDMLDAWLGKDEARVILPITDPYVAHHGALGSFATVYLPADADVAALLDRLRAVEGIELVLAAGGSLPPLRTAARPDRRHRDDIDRAQGARHQPRAARPHRAHRAVALAWRRSPNRRCR